MAHGSAGIPGARLDGQTDPVRAGSITEVAGAASDTITADPDVTLGSGWASGSTVVLAPPGTVGGVDVRGEHRAVEKPNCSTLQQRQPCRRNRADGR